jgi:hypothetical protein
MSWQPQLLSPGDSSRVTLVRHPLVCSVRGTTSHELRRKHHRSPSTNRIVQRISTVLDVFGTFFETTPPASSDSGKRPIVPVAPANVYRAVNPVTAPNWVMLRRVFFSSPKAMPDSVQTTIVKAGFNITRSGTVKDFRSKRNNAHARAYIGRSRESFRQGG